MYQIIRLAEIQEVEGDQCSGALILEFMVRR